METIPSQRRFELDWLRVIAIFSVFVFHCTLIFAIDPYQVKNTTLYQYLDDLGWFFGSWGMPLIFIISGASAFMALNKVSPGKYVKGLVLRLLLPLVLCIFTASAFQVYLERVGTGEFNGSFFAFYPHYFEGMYGFGGNFSWFGMHLWYLEALFISSLLCLPVFLWLKRSNIGQRTLKGMTDLLAHPFAIYLLCLPATLIYNLFDPDGLGTTVLGGWSIFNYLGFFVAGFLVISNSRLQANIARMRWVSFAVGFFAWPMVDVVWNALGKPAFGTPQFALGTLFYCLFAWCWLLAIFGFAFRYLNHDKPFVRYANEAVLPFYILHQTVLLLIAFYVVRWNIPDVAKFFIILIASFGITMSIYELLIRRHNLLRILFGTKLLTRTASIPAVESQAAAPARSL